MGFVKKFLQYYWYISVFNFACYDKSNSKIFFKKYTIQSWYRNAIFFLEFNSFKYKFVVVGRMKKYLSNKSIESMNIH